MPGLVEQFYEARQRGDEAEIRALLADDVVWHEPPVNDVTGDLIGPDAVLRMMREAQSRTNGTFRLRVNGGVANQSHAAARIDWTAIADGRHLQGSEIAVFRIREGQIAEAWFFQQDICADAAFWGVDITAAGEPPAAPKPKPASAT